MPALNRVQLIGRVGKDPEFRMAGEAKVANFSFAISEKYKGEEKTEWVNIVMWNKNAEILERYVKKGDLLYLEGKMQTRSWEKDGVKRYTTEVNAFSFQMLGSKGQQSQAPAQAPVQANFPEDDLPF